MSKSENIVIATIKSWNIDNAKRFQEKYAKTLNVSVLTSKEELNLLNLSEIEPRFIFFPHWSWKIPKEIYERYECIVFHSTDLPFGRGGSPVQNLISRRLHETKVSAVRVVEKMDAGPLYMKESLSLYGSTAEEIYMRMSQIIFEKMLPRIIEDSVTPVPQTGEVTVFKRFRPEDSLIDKAIQLESLFDKIRMLDAEGYPKAFLELDNLVLEFSRAALYSDGIHADVVIKRKDEYNEETNTDNCSSS